LQQRTNAAIEASIQKTQFIATLSHELRTPLHGVIACADMLRHTTLDDSQTSFVKIIAKSSNILLGLISNILDLAKIESGKMDLEVKSFSLHDTLTSVTSLTKINKTNSAKVILHTDNIPEFVTGDESRLTQVLINLINNALKFSYGTSDVTVNVSKLQETDSEYELLFHVTDKGIGIEMNSHELLFHSYFQADSSISRRFGGTGLGLSICQKILSLMRGKIWLEKSVPNEGSTFAFTCWMGKSADINRPVSPLPETKYQIKDLRLLVAEDNNINRKVMSKMLEKIGVQHFTMAKDGEQGFIEYTRQEYDIVLTDLSMPVMNGLDLARAIRDFEKKDNRKRCMIVAITANATEETQKECEASGMDKFVTKPILTDALNSILTKLL
jgi:CheY-like chemotaxis protein